MSSLREGFKKADKVTLGIGALCLAAGAAFTHDYTSEKEGIALAQKCFTQKQECTAQEYIQAHKTDKKSGQGVPFFVLGGVALVMSSRRRP